MAQTLETISILFFVAAGVFAALAALLWFVLRIPAVAGDLSGRNARRSIEEMRKKAAAGRSGPVEWRRDLESRRGDPEETALLELSRITLIEEILYIHTEDVI